MLLFISFVTQAIQNLYTEFICEIIYNTRGEKIDDKIEMNQSKRKLNQMKLVSFL